MPVKYYCPKCSKRFVEWGAEKLGFKCPYCQDEEMTRLGSHGAPVKTKPSLKKKAAKKGKAAKSKKAAVVPKLAKTVDVDLPDKSLDADFGLTEEILTISDDDNENIVDADEGLPADLAFGFVAPPVGEVSPDSK